MRDVLPYGSWPSPITTELVVAGASNPTDVWAADGQVWWSESRPAEGGRIQLMRLSPDGRREELLPEGWSARTRVHEYGGGAWWVHGEAVFFTSWADQRVYRLDPGGRPPGPITPEPPSPHAWRYADGRVTPDGQFVVCVRESHEGERVANEIVVFPVDGSTPPRVLVTGRDFVAAPRISRDGRQLAWLTWDHPDMPWDSTELWVARLDHDGPELGLSGARREAGGDGESLVQPEWGRHGYLFVVSDCDEWWNVYRVDGVDVLTPVHAVEAEVGRPAWVFGQSRYALTRDGTVVFTFERDGCAVVAQVPESGGYSEHVTAAAALGQLRVDGENIVAIASSVSEEPSIVRASRADPAAPSVLRPARDLQLDPAVISRPRHIQFPSADGRQAHAWFYEPTHPGAEGPEGERPPLVVMIHGGPTAAARPVFNLDVQFWTSRGLAVVDVDYGGSTGYGRAYRRLLDGGWGVVDVEDCCAAAEHLAAEGLVDPARLAITGGSAGGFTTLVALAVRDTFAAGTSAYGVADLGALARDTHKFEARYLDRLVGPWPEAEDVYQQRSPLSMVDQFDKPLLVLQGLEDEVVPPAQAEMIVDALAARGVPHAYLAFEGEQHGFRRAETIVSALSAELAFYAQVFGFTPADDLPPLEVVNADRLRR